MTDRRKRASSGSAAPATIAFWIFLALASAAALCGLLYWAAHQMAEIQHKAADTVPAYRRCRDMAERLKEAGQDNERLERGISRLQETNGWLPRSMWPEDDRLEYETLWKKHDDLAKRYNKTAAEYFETMRTYDMRFSDPDRLPPDVVETLPYYFYPIYRPKLDD